MKDLFVIHDGFEYKAKKLYSAALNILEKSEALQNIAVMLAKIEDDFIRLAYVDSIAKLIKVKKSQLDESVKGINRGSAQEYDEDIKDILAKLPKSVDPEDFLRRGFYELLDTEKKYNTGYYFASNGNRDAQSISNFVIKPLFHLYSDSDNKKVIAINNGWDEKFVEIPSDAMIKLDAFAGRMVNEGNYLFKGNRMQLMLINEKIMGDFPLAYELKTLGWQSDGKFFAFSDCVIKNRKISFDEFGLVKVDDLYYYSPSTSKVYQYLRGSDLKRFQQDYFLRYKQSEVSFEKWAELFKTVYGENANVGIASIIMSAFVDIIAAVDGNAPLLFMYGEKGSGKSKFAESLSNFFFVPNPFSRKFNLNSGTDYAFASFKERFANTFTFYNEYDDKACPEHWFQQLKAAYDREGRERGMMGVRNKVEIQEVTGLIGLVGQYITSRDDNSLLSRSIVLTFAPNEKRTEKQNKAYDSLKKHEQDGLNSLAGDLMQLRHVFEDNYKNYFDDAISKLREKCTVVNAKWHDRIYRNHAHMIAVMRLVVANFRIKFDAAAFFDETFGRCVRLVQLLSKSDELSNFWRIISSMCDTGELVRGYHYQIKAVTAIKVRNEDSDRRFTTTKKILFMRFRSVYTLFKKQYKSETGKEAMQEESFVNYFQNREYYIGPGDKMRFAGKDKHGISKETAPTSYYMFDYEMMENIGIELDFNPINAPENIEPNDQYSKIDPFLNDNQMPF